jgi:hypothetical protein
MNIRYISKFVFWMAGLVLVFPAYGQTKPSNLKCGAVGGVMSTDLGAVDQQTTMGVSTGDLKGAVSASILDVTANSDGTVSFVVQHHFVTESGDMISFGPATAVTQPVSSTRYAILDYPVTIKGGSGKYTNATGKLDSIGEVDLGSGQTVFRYSGKLCLASAD